MDSQCYICQPSTVFGAISTNIKVNTNFNSNKYCDDIAIAYKAFNIAVDIIKHTGVDINHISNLQYGLKTLAKEGTILHIVSATIYYIGTAFYVEHFIKIVKLLVINGADPYLEVNGKSAINLLETHPNYNHHAELVEWCKDYCSSNMLVKSASFGM